MEWVWDEIKEFKCKIFAKLFPNTKCELEIDYKFKKIISRNFKYCNDEMSDSICNVTSLFLTKGDVVSKWTHLPYRHNNGVLFSLLVIITEYMLS